MLDEDVRTPHGGGSKKSAAKGHFEIGCVGALVNLLDAGYLSCEATI